MPFHQITLDHSHKQAQLESLTLEKFQRFVVWWYGGVTRNIRDNWVPLVVVWFRRLHDDGSLGEFHKSTVAITSLGQLRIGSVWENARSREQVRYATKRFHVKFSEEQWTGARSRADTRSLPERSLISSTSYPLPYTAADRSKILSFNHSEGTLQIPCLEFLRCYGRNQEVNRVLTMFNWDEVTRRLRLAEPVPFSKDLHVIDLPTFASEQDAHLLAHMRYEKFAKHWVRRITSDIENQLGPRSSRVTYAFPTIGPWYEGPAQLEVEGLQTGDGTFLGLRITGYSVPSKPGIQCQRSEFPTDASQVFSGRPHPAQRFKHIEENEVTRVADNLAPDLGSEVVVISDPSIRILGDAAEVVKISRRDSLERGVPGPVPEDSEVSAPGDGKGTGKGIGRAQFNSAIELEPRGALRDLWNGLKHIRAQHPTILTRLGWWTLDGSRSTNDAEEPSPVGLYFPDGDETKERLSSDAKRWVYMHPKLPDKPRGVLIVEISSPLTHGYLFEVQRKVIQTKDSGNKNASKEQNYCGLAVKAPNGKVPREWVPTVLFQIAQSEGIMSKVLASIPWIDGLEYRRSFSTSDTVVGQSTALNALKKLGIVISRTKDSQGPRNNGTPN